MGSCSVVISGGWMVRLLCWLFGGALTSVPAALCAALGG